MKGILFYLFFKRYDYGTNTIQYEELYLRINTTGHMFLSDICNRKYICIQELTERQIGIILSLQESIHKSRNNHWKVNNKKKRGGNINMEQMRETFFQTEN